VRRQILHARARPVIDELAAFLDGSLPKLSGKGELAGAMRYARGRWEALTRYLDDGRLEISNNAAERAIRPLALRRKNYTFAGSDAGGERAAAIYTLVETAKFNVLDPKAYLRDVLSRIADHPINRIADLLPCNVAKGCRRSRCSLIPAVKPSKPQPSEDAYDGGAARAAEAALTRRLWLAGGWCLRRAHVGRTISGLTTSLRTEPMMAGRSGC